MNQMKNRISSETRNHAVAAAFALGALSLMGCRSELTGNLGNFVFSYTADDDVNNFNKPVAVGGKLDVQVHEVGAARAEVNLTSAAFDDPELLDVDSFNGNDITVLGVGDGSALLEVEGETTGGETLPDEVNMLARVPEVLKMWHTCDEGGLAKYFTDQRIWVAFDLEMDNGQPVIGYGYYPVTSSDTDALALEVAAGTQAHMAFQTGAAATDDVSLTSDIDDTSLAFHVVTKAMVDGIREPSVFTVEDIDVGDKGSGYVLPTVGDVPVCQADIAKTVTSDTPDLCSVTDREPPADGDNSREFGWFEIEGLAAGECLYTVTYPDGNDGAGVSQQFSVTIEP